MKLTPKTTRVLGVCLAVLVIGATLAVGLGSRQTRAAALDATIKSDLQTQGLNVTDVRLNPTDNSIQIIISSRQTGASGDAWARMVAEREVSYLAAAGLSAGTVDVKLVDEKGATVFESAGPIEPQPRPVVNPVKSDAFAPIQASLAPQALEQGISLTTISVAQDPAQGTVVTIDLTAAGGTDLSEQIRYATQQLGGQVADFARGAGHVDVDLYRMTIEDPSGMPLVDYIVDVKARSVHTWAAPGLQPVWSDQRPPGAVALSPTAAQ